MKQFFAVSLLALAFSACATQTIRFTNDYSSSPANLEKSQPFFISGLGQTQEIQASTVCKRGFDRVETKQTVMDVLLGVVTFGIYTPRTLAVYCK